MATPMFRFDPIPLPPETQKLRAEVREFIAEHKHVMGFSRGDHNREFSKAMGKKGWIGMTWPKQYGGQERSYLERFVVTEEMLAFAAPCAAHWMGDRQAGPSLLRYGSEHLKQKCLPAITRGEMAFALGMSEPNSGSDLASVRTRAEKVDGGWRITGQKVWTSWAHKADAFFVLCRTAPNTGDRHQEIGRAHV